MVHLPDDTKDSIQTTTTFPPDLLCAPFAVQFGQSPSLWFYHIFSCGDLVSSKGLVLYIIMLLCYAQC